MQLPAGETERKAAQAEPALINYNTHAPERRGLFSLSVTSNLPPTQRVSPGEYCEQRRKELVLPT